MTVDRPLFGILLMIGFCILAPMGNAIAKLLGEAIPLIQVLIVRFAFQFVLLGPVVWRANIKINMSWRTFILTFIRTLLQIAGITATFVTLRFLPLADALAIAFVMPFIMLLLGSLVLGEEVGIHRIVACVVGFMGALLVIQPSFAVVGAPALLPLLVAVIFAVFMLVTRQIAKKIDPIGLQMVSGLFATGSLGVVYFVAADSGLVEVNFVVPSYQSGLLLAIFCVIGMFAHLLMAWALRFAPSATLAPMQYLEIPIATFLGWLIFKDLPNELAAVGIAITVGAGLYIVLKEQRKAQTVPAER